MASIDLVELLSVCARASLAAQQYVMLDLIKLPSVEAQLHTRDAKASDAPHDKGAPRTVLDLSEAERAVLLQSLRGAVQVDVKSHLDYKTGDAAEDLVTTADVLTQAVLTHALEHAFPQKPFTVVGEEEEPSSAIAEEAAACVRRYYEHGPPMPHEQELRAHVQKHAVSGVESSSSTTVSADTVEALRRRVGIFIDPIDGTNCFFGGVWQAPMTLVGITVDGLPLAAVMNRVFCYPLTSTTAAGGAPANPPSLSFVLNAPGVASPFVVMAGQIVAPATAPGKEAPPPVITPDSELIVCRSSTTKEEALVDILHQLQPCRSLCARGAGYKQYHLLRRIWPTEPTSGEAVADVFICPANTIKKWDCCAPHAFLHAVGGGVYAQDGTAQRYPLTCEDGSDGTHLELAALPKGLVAVTPYATAEVARRMQWSPYAVE